MSPAGSVSRETPADDLEVIESSRIRIVNCRGERLEIRPLTIGQLPGFARSLGPVIEAVNRSLDKEVAIADIFSLEFVMRLVEEYTDHLVKAVSVAVRKDEGWVGEVQADEFLELVTAILAVNTDFFVRRLLPMLTGRIDALVGVVRKLAGGGPTPSSS